MEASMTTRVTFAAAFLLILAFAAAMAQGTAQQQPQANMQDMMKMHQQMMVAMKADDAKLDTMLKDMNVAVGDAKLNALAAVVTELARQHRTAHGQMGQMHQQMMGMMGGRGMGGR
jgi:hypothetical protein